MDIVNAGMNIDSEYELYKQHYEGLIEMGDLREYMIQEYVIRIFLSHVLEPLDIIPTHIKLNDKNSVHDYRKYCGISKAGKTVTPDLCIAKGWKWNNSSFDDYRAIVEVKTPVSIAISPYVITKDTTGKKSRYHEFDFKNISEISNSYLREELLTHSQTNDTKRNSKIIFTDGITWFFIENSIVKNRYNLGARRLHRYINSKSKIVVEFLGIDWEKNEVEEMDDPLMVEFFGEGISYSKAPDVFVGLVDEIKRFV